MDGELSAELVIFMEETWVKAYNHILGTKRDSHATSMIVDQVVSGRDNGYRFLDEIMPTQEVEEHGFLVNQALRALKTNTPGDWFNVYALFDYTCQFCPSYDDDGPSRKLLLEEPCYEKVFRDLEDYFCERLIEDTLEEVQGMDGCFVLFT